MLNLHCSKTSKKGKGSGNLELLWMTLPGMLCIIIFSYLPMLGIILSFKDYRYDKGLWASEWVGFDNFKFFFTSQDALRVTVNTVGLNVIFITIGTIVSVLFALMLYEVTTKMFIKIYQTIMFIPYFISWVVVGFALNAFLRSDLGILNTMLEKMGIEGVSWYTEPVWWPLILTLAFVWKSTGYYSILYYAALTGIDRSYFESARIDGANKFQITRKITLPFLTPLISILVLLQIGRIFYSDFGMFYNLTMNSGVLYSTTDVIDTYVFRSLKVVGDIGMSSAVGLYQSLIGFLLVFVSNYVVKKFNLENSLY